ncbi:MerR family DNA-binding transcriptional regulator [Tabrizicola sp.]|uniref:MerR family DNA-binding transcriptional regulator n=1 Tax=Tabrizicola sp. TaxID=2005166 RepID=UPI002FDDFC14
MKIGELSRRAGVAVDTLRYDERIGLLPPTPRDAGGRRDYDAAALVWLAFLGRLKVTGMPLAEMSRCPPARRRPGNGSRAPDTP